MTTRDGHRLRDAANTWQLKGYRSGWNVAGPTAGLGALQPYLAKSVESSYDLPTSKTEDGRTTTTAGARLTTVTTDTAVDAWGNPTGITVTTDDHANTKRFEQVTTNTYGAASDTWSKRFGRLTRAVVRQRRDEGGDGVYETDGHPQRDVQLLPRRLPQGPAPHRDPAAGRGRAQTHHRV